MKLQDTGSMTLKLSGEYDIKFAINKLKQLELK